MRFIFLSTIMALISAVNPTVASAEAKTPKNLQKNCGEIVGIRQNSEGWNIVFKDKELTVRRNITLMPFIASSMAVGSPVCVETYVLDGDNILSSVMRN